MNQQSMEAQRADEKDVQMESAEQDVVQDSVEDKNSKIDNVLNDMGGNEQLSLALLENPQISRAELENIALDRLASLRTVVEARRQSGEDSNDAIASYLTAKGVYQEYLVERLCGFIDSMGKDKNDFLQRFEKGMTVEELHGLNQILSDSPSLSAIEDGIKLKDNMKSEDLSTLKEVAERGKTKSELTQEEVEKLQQVIGQNQDALSLIARMKRLPVDTLSTAADLSEGSSIETLLRALLTFTDYYSEGVGDMLWSDIDKEDRVHTKDSFLDSAFGSKDDMGKKIEFGKKIVEEYGKNSVFVNCLGLNDEQKKIVEQLKAGDIQSLYEFMNVLARQIFKGCEAEISERWKLLRKILGEMVNIGDAEKKPLGQKVFTFFSDVALGNENFNSRFPDNVITEAQKKKITKKQAPINN